MSDVFTVQRQTDAAYLLTVGCRLLEARALPPAPGRYGPGHVTVVFDFAAEEARAAWQEWRQADDFNCLVPAASYVRHLNRVYSFARAARLEGRVVPNDVHSNQPAA